MQRYQIMRLPWGVNRILLTIFFLGLIENGTGNPSLKLLKRLADGMGMILKLEFVPEILLNFKVFPVEAARSPLCRAAPSYPDFPPAGYKVSPVFSGYP